MKSILLLDADFLAYSVAAANQQSFDFGDGVVSTQTSELENAIPSVDAEIAKLQKKLKADAILVALSCPSLDCWRCDVLPTYKQNRTAPKPLLLAGLKQHMRETYATMERPRLEADDICGILATSSTIPVVKEYGRKIVVSIDKDLKTIPGWLYNPQKDTKPKLIDEGTADYWHMYQTLVGDTTDGYKGCPGIGPVKAQAILLRENKWTGAGLPPVGWAHSVMAQWSDVWDAFADKGLTFGDALVQARVARICRASDYDFKAKQVKLWEPPK